MRFQLIAILLFTFSASLFAQTTDTFDLASFQSPKGWHKSVAENSIQFSTENKANGSFCLVTMFKSMPAIGTASENFNAAWSTVVAEAVSTQAKPQMFPDEKKSNWDLRSGYAPFEKNGEKGVAMLFVSSLSGRMMIVMILTNTTDHETSIQQFLSSINLKTPSPVPVKPAPANAADNAAIVGQWGISLSPQDSYSVNNGINGYTTRQYTFNANGTYEFLTKLFAYTSSNLLFTKETGTYILSGNSLTLTPQEGSIQAWTKATVTGADGRPAQTDKWGKLVSDQSWPLEKITYRISREYMSGTEKWQLRMVAANPTKRDGPFTGSSAFPNTWFYETMRFPIDPPR